MRTPSAAVLLVAALLTSGLALPSQAVVIASGDGQGNTSSPRRDLPWHHVGRRGDFSAVYLGHRWVLTAAHVGAASVEFVGQSYAPVPGSATTIRNPDGSPSDLLAFRIDPIAPTHRRDAVDANGGANPSAPEGRRDPRLPLLPLARARPHHGSALVLAGNGHDRGARLEGPGPGRSGLRGWLLAPTRALRWGTNRVDADLAELTFRGIRTYVLAMTFTPPGAPSATPHEAQAVTGDSGGAVFAWQDGHFVLAGIMIVRSEDPTQPAGAALFGNRTFAADLSAYREQLVALTRPDCADERDNDDDGAIDFPDDRGCIRPADDSEKGPRRRRPAR